jgi:hypothetical protein
MYRNVIFLVENPFLYRMISLFNIENSFFRSQIRNPNPQFRNNLKKNVI